MIFIFTFGPQYADISTMEVMGGITVARQKNVNFRVKLSAMFRRLKEFYRQYKPYVRVDLVMYGVLILLIILYFVFSVLFLN